MSLVTFLSDYGLQDEYVGVCHGVILSRAPRAQIIDITHCVPPQQIATGALLLAAALAYMPPAVHLAVVDPGVGAVGADARRAVAIACVAQEGTRPHYLVGPDNGLLLPAARRLGAIAEVVEIGDSRARIQPTSATFHGRDIFAPVAGALAAGARLEQLGEPLAPELLVELPPAARPARAAGALRATVLQIDAFGNLTFDLAPQALEELSLELGAEVVIEAPGRSDRTPAKAGLRARVGRTFADVPAGDAILHVDSRNLLALAINRGSAAQALAVGNGTQLLIRPAHPARARAPRRR
jgi:S-adenosylmethionine hydrolase